MMIDVVLPMIVSMATWMTAMPSHAEGLLVFYGSQQLIEVNAEFRGYDLSPYRNRCGVSAISPADLGKVVWVRVSDTDWFGPCLTVDVASQRDFYHIVYRNQEIAEVAAWMRDLYRFKYGSSRRGELFTGVCPPEAESQPARYAPPLLQQEYTGRNPRLRSPSQQYPVECADRDDSEKR